MPSPDAPVGRERIPAAEIALATAVFALVQSADGRYRIASSPDDGVAPASFNVGAGGRLYVNSPAADGAVPIVRVGGGRFIL